jgi:hypothetical protein
VVVYQRRGIALSLALLTLAAFVFGAIAVLRHWQGGDRPAPMGARLVGNFDERGVPNIPLSWWDATDRADKGSDRKSSG